MVSAWCEGIQLETGQPYARPAAGAISTLVGALNAHRPTTPGADLVAWARTDARAYARATAGLKLSPFGYTDWANSGRPVRDRESGVRPRALPDDHNPNPRQVAPAPLKGEALAREIERAKRDVAARAGGSGT